MNSVGGCRSLFYTTSGYKSAVHAPAATSPASRTSSAGDVVAISGDGQKTLALDKAFNRSEELMRVRGLDDEEIASFRDILSRYRSSGMDAKEFLTSLSTGERDLVKRANSYGSTLSDAVIAGFSEEGAVNMLREQDYRFAVDLNGDDIVEHGAGKTFVFPPPSAPEEVMDGWDKFSQTLTGEEKMLFSALFLPVNIPGHPDASTIRGYNISQQGFPQSREGWLELLNKIYDTLEYNNSISSDRQSIEHNKKAMQQLRDFAACIG